MATQDYQAVAQGLGEDARRRAQQVASASASVLAELPGDFGEASEAEVAAYIRGEIDAHQLAERTASYWRKRSAGNAG
ncbi:MAG: hypothetical protein M0Z87_11960 [Actinomycetota bacterium]|nr:hypothetical protein [Actinomycetota bacterium]